jgi:hypothetical protein
VTLKSFQKRQTFSPQLESVEELWEKNPFSRSMGSLVGWPCYALFKDIMRLIIGSAALQPFFNMLVACEHGVQMGRSTQIILRKAEKALSAAKTRAAAL